MNPAPSRNLFGLSLAEIEALVTALGEPRFRGAQIYSWLYAKRVSGIEAMTNLKGEFRAALAGRYDVRRIAVADREFSTDGTIKSLFRCDDGATIESVYIPEARRQTMREVYRQNGAVYAVAVEDFLAQDRFYVRPCHGVVVPAEDSVDIDSEMDLMLAELILQKRRT